MQIICSLKLQLFEIGSPKVTRSIIMVTNINFVFTKSAASLNTYILYREKSCRTIYLICEDYLHNQDMISRKVSYPTQPPPSPLSIQLKTYESFQSEKTCFFFINRSKDLILVFLTKCSINLFFSLPTIAGKYSF